MLDTASDIVRQGWLGRLPPRLQAFAELARLDRPIGTWLLLFPCWWGVALAGSLDWRLYALFGIGALVMRGAGCTINDLLDRKFDAMVARTRQRPLPSGRVSVPEAILFLGAQLLIGLVVLVQFPLLTIKLGVSILGVVATYPLMKRITWWPQFFLGLAFNWGAILGWPAARGEFGWPSVALYVGGIAWTLGYDTIYAHQDKDDDEKIGVRSTARLLATRSRIWIGGFYAVALVAIGIAGFMTGIGWPFYIGLAVAAGLFAHQLATVDFDDPKSCLATFKANTRVGWAVLAGLIAGHLIVSAG